MIEIEGKYNKAIVFTDTVEQKSKEQVARLCDQEFTKGSKIRLMPDIHAGMGCTIGTTMEITDKIVPNLVGVDIGCGMETALLRKSSKVLKRFDVKKLDKIIKSEIPCGMNIRQVPHELSESINLSYLKCPGINIARAKKSIGSLGGGNHFIEVDTDDEDNLYIVVHSGSRHLGTEIAKYYQDEAFKQLNKTRKSDIDKEIEALKAQGKTQEIQKLLSGIKGRVITDVPRDLAYVSRDLFDDYINDMKITQAFANLNRKAMIDVILRNLEIRHADEQFTTIHNYIDTDHMILRKGAISAMKGEKLLIPINMRDGSLICEGLGNPDWNYSAPHGAGRLMSRTDAFSRLSVTEFKKTMAEAGIYSTCVNTETLDESPMAYKPMDEIIKNIEGTVNILKIIKPIYNFKASE
jgi:RNA-splicing ligase RtcB